MPVSIGEATLSMIGAECPITRSMSSENRAIIPNDFESDVPPLNVRCPAISPASISRRRVQQTHRSFSTTVAVTSRRAAASSRNAWRSSGERRAKLSIALTVDFQDRVAHPARHLRARAPQNSHVFISNPAGEAADLIVVEIVFPDVRERLEHGIRTVWRIVENRCAAMFQRETATCRTLYLRPAACSKADLRWNLR